jgi:hypothetical protein
MGAAQSGHIKSLAFRPNAADIACTSFPSARDPMPISAYRLAQQYYARLRRNAYDQVEREVWEAGFVRVPLRITDTDAHTVAAWRAQWGGAHPTGDGNWEWDRILARAWRRPAAFHVAIWSGEHLCGLAVGRASKRRLTGVRHTISVHFIESAHSIDHPLRHRIAPLVIAAAVGYGRQLGAWRIRLINPLPGALPLYERYGFTVARKAGQSLYCERRISP